jgi:hypothetical protein
MAYRLYSGPSGTPDLPPLDETTALYKEFTRLDEALSFARHLQKNNRVPLIIEGDDGTRLSRREIAAALVHAEADIPEPKM